MEELLAEFIAETRETHEAITGEILAWEQDPADRTHVDAIFRFVHTVKGSCGFLDLQRLQKLSHEAETVLSDVRSGGREANRHVVNAILAVIDRIASLIAALEAGEDIESGNDEDLFVRLRGDGAVDTGAQAAEESTTTHVAPSQPMRTIRVPVELLDSLMGGVSDLVLARNELSRRLRYASVDSSIDTAFEKVSASITEMRDTISRARMQRIERLFAALPRLVRDLSAELGKSVSLQIVGADVELDRELIEMLRDPLTHIVRNALDHGIEAPGQRREAGKNPNGILRVSARQSGNQILIEIFDDGRGISDDRLVEKAIDAGVVDQSEAATMSDERKLALIFEPGLSTAQEVSEVSGRGVGMDVVRANVERVGGSIELKSQNGLGTTLVLRVPLTLTIIPSLIIGLGDLRYAVPRLSIDRISSLEKKQALIETIGGTEVASISGRRIPLVRLPDLLGVRESSGADRFVIVVKLGKGERYAIAVPDVFVHEDLVAKPVAQLVSAAKIYAGSALPDSGRPLLLLDPVAIAEQTGLRLSEIHHGALDYDHDAESPDEVTATRYLTFDDLDGVRRALPVSIVEHVAIVSSADVFEGRNVKRVVCEGRTVPITAYGELPISGSLNLLTLSDGTSQLFYAVAGEVEAIDFAGALEAAPQAGRVAGFFTTAGQTIEVIEPHALFAQNGHRTVRRNEGVRPRCLLVGGDRRWLREFLAPLVEASGYDAVVDSDGTPVDVVIDLEDDGDHTEGKVGDTIRLSSMDGGEGNAIYRYDRDAIRNALRQRLAVGKGK